MLLFRFLPRILPLLGLLAIFSAPVSAPSFADEVIFLDSVAQAGKGKKGEAPPRPRPKPGPREGGDDD